MNFWLLHCSNMGTLHFRAYVILEMFLGTGMRNFCFCPSLSVQNSFSGKSHFASVIVFLLLHWCVSSQCLCHCDCYFSKGAEDSLLVMPWIFFPLSKHCSHQQVLRFHIVALLAKKSYWPTCSFSQKLNNICVFPLLSSISFHHVCFWTWGIFTATLAEENQMYIE